MSDAARIKLGIKRVSPTLTITLVGAAQTGRSGSCRSWRSCSSLSQLTRRSTSTSVEHLWIVSTLLGLAYGSLFNVIPMLVLEWFGMRKSRHIAPLRRRIR